MSCITANKFGVPAQYCPDLTISNNFQYHACSRKGIGITGSVYYEHDLSLRTFARATQSEFVSMTKTKPPSLKCFITHRIGKFQRSWRDLNRYLDIDWTRQPRTPAQLIAWIATKSLIITGRYHTVTLCILTHTPFLFLESNTPTISALCEDVGLRKNRRIERADLFASPQTTSLIQKSAFDKSETSALVNFTENHQHQFKDLGRALKKMFADALLIST